MYPSHADKITRHVMNTVISAITAQLNPLEIDTDLDALVKRKLSRTLQMLEADINRLYQTHPIKNSLFTGILVTHIAQLKFARLHYLSAHAPKDEGWAIANVYLHNDKHIAVLSERMTPTGDWDSGPDNKYTLSLTNGIEAAFTSLARQCQKLNPRFTAFDDLIQHTPARPRPHHRGSDPADYVRVHLVWDSEMGQYVTHPDKHPWSPITENEVEELIGFPAQAIQLD